MRWWATRREPLSPRASAGRRCRGASSRDDVKFWRERALRLANPVRLTFGRRLRGRTPTRRGGGRAGCSAPPARVGRRNARRTIDEHVRRPCVLDARWTRTRLPSGPPATGRKRDEPRPTPRSRLCTRWRRTSPSEPRLSTPSSPRSPSARRTHEKRARAWTTARGARGRAAGTQARHIARLVEDVERSLRPTPTGLRRRIHGARCSKRRARARRVRRHRATRRADTSPSFAEDEGRRNGEDGEISLRKRRPARKSDDNAVTAGNYQREEAGALKEAGGFQRGRPREVAFSGFAFSPPASPPRRAGLFRGARVRKPPWDKRVALDTSRDDGARARRDARSSRRRGRVRDQTRSRP